MTGMLWFDNDPKTTLLQKIDRATAYYKKKYGCDPTFCELNPQNIPEVPSKHNEIVILTTTKMPKNYLFIGVNS